MNPNNTQEARKKKGRTEENVAGPSTEEQSPMIAETLPSTAVDNEEDIMGDNADQEINVVDIDDDGEEEEDRAVVASRQADQNNGQNWLNHMMWFFYNQLNDPRKNEVQMTYTTEEETWMKSLKDSHVIFTSTLVPPYLFEVFCVFFII